MINTRILKNIVGLIAYEKIMVSCSSSVHDMQITSWEYKFSEFVMLHQKVFFYATKQISEGW